MILILSSVSLISPSLKEHNKKLPTPIPRFPRNFIQCNNLLNSRKPQEFSFQPDTLDVISLSSNIFKFILSLRIPSIPIEMMKQRNKNKSDEVEGERKERLWSSSGLIIPNGGGKRASLKARHLIYPATPARRNRNGQLRFLISVLSADRPLAMDRIDPTGDTSRVVDTFRQRGRGEADNTR